METHTLSESSSSFLHDLSYVKVQAFRARMYDCRMDATWTAWDWHEVPDLL